MVIYNPYTKKTHPGPPLPMGRNNNNKRPRPPEESNNNAYVNNNNNAKHGDQYHQQHQHGNSVRASTQQRDSTLSNLDLSNQSSANFPSISAMSFSQPVPSTANACAQKQNNLYHRLNNAACTNSFIHRNNNNVSTAMSQPAMKDSRTNSDSDRSMTQPQPLPQQPKNHRMAAISNNPYLSTPKSSTKKAASDIKHTTTTNVTTPGCITKRHPTQNPYRQQSPAVTTSAVVSNNKNILRKVEATNATVSKLNSDATKAMTTTKQFRSDIIGPDSRNGSTYTSNSVIGANTSSQTSHNNVPKHTPDIDTTSTHKATPINVTNRITSATTSTNTSTSKRPYCTSQTTSTAISSLCTTNNIDASISNFQSQSMGNKGEMQFPSNVSTTAPPLRLTSTTTKRQGPISTVASIRPSSWMNKQCISSTDLDRKAAPGQTSNETMGRGRGGSATAVHSNNNDIKKQAEAPGEEPLPKQLKYNPEQMRPIDDGYRKLLVENAELSKPLLNKWTLYKHQKRAIVQGLVRRRMILALDMGLGKTVIGCVWSKSFKATFKDLKILVVCPVSLREEWKRTAENATGLSVEWGKKKEPSSKKAKKKKEENEAHFQILSSSTSLSYLNLEIHSWAKVPTAVDSRVQNFVVVFDEAHSMQNIDSVRTKNSLKLIDSERCVGVLLLTGTPMKNGKPCNLFPLLKAVRHPLGGHQRAYETHFCNGTERPMNGKRVWDASGCSNLTQLNRMVSTNLLHLTKEQCLDELPPITTEKRQVPISSRNQIQYIRAVKDLEIVEQRKKSGNLKEDQQEAVLGSMQKLRVLCAHAKIRATVEFAKEILEEEPAVVIFSNFAKVAEQVHTQLANSGWEGELLTGNTPQNKRQGMVDKFQEGLSPVFVCTFGAGGVGLTLTAASTIILVDRPWTSGETRQAEDRVRRIGQKKPVKSIWMTAFELDTQIDAMIESKVKVTNAVLGSRGAKEQRGSFTGEVSKISVSKLAASLIGSLSNLQS